MMERERTMLERLDDLERQVWLLEEEPGMEFEVIALERERAILRGMLLKELEAERDPKILQPAGWWKGKGKDESTI